MIINEEKGFGRGKMFMANWFASDLTMSSPKDAMLLFYILHIHNIHASFVSSSVRFDNLHWQS